MRVFLPVLLTSLILSAGCAGTDIVAHSEQGLARRISHGASVEGILQSATTSATVRTTWGIVPIQLLKPAAPPIPSGSYVRVTGLVARGRLVNNKFLPSQADSRGLRPARDLVLCNASIEHREPPATQPATFPVTP